MLSHLALSLDWDKSLLYSSNHGSFVKTLDEYIIKWTELFGQKIIGRLTMDLTPFQKVTNVPRGKFFPESDGVRDVLGTHDLIDIISLFGIESVRSTILPNFRGMGAFVFDASMYFGFNNSYEITEIEFRLSLSHEWTSGLLFNDLNLMQPTLLDVQEKFNSANIPTVFTDVGLEAPAIGVSFFSNEFEKDLSVKLDSVTVHFPKST
jgi:hypothetical protein